MPLKGKKPDKVRSTRPIILIYGAGGVGKTYGALGFPNPYILDTDGGATRTQYVERLKTSGGAYVGPEDGINDLQAIIREVKELATSRHDYKTVIIDSLSRPYTTKIALEYSSMEDSGAWDMTRTFGAESKLAKSLAKQLIAWLEKADMNVVLICYERAAWADGKVVGYTWDGDEKWNYDLDLCCRITQDPATGIREATVTKTRITQFPLWSSFEWSEQEFAKLYGEEIIEADHKPLQLATGDQVQELVYLETECAHIFDGKLKKKWFDKDGIDDWSEMSRDHATKAIKWFQTEKEKARGKK